MMHNFDPRKSRFVTVVKNAVYFGVGVTAVIFGYAFAASLTLGVLSGLVDRETAARVVIPIVVAATCWHISKTHVTGLAVSIAARLQIVLWVYVVTLVSMVDSDAGGFVLGSLLAYPLIIGGDKLLKVSDRKFNAKTTEISAMEISAPAAPAESNHNPIRIETSN